LSGLTGDLGSFLGREGLGSSFPALQAAFPSGALSIRLGFLWFGRLLDDPISHLVEISHRKSLACLWDEILYARI
jgi:hypothetical protein